MKIARVESRCECQAQLVAELDESRSVVRGFVQDRERGRELAAPANATKKIGDKQIDVGWSCPMCTRNTLRTFNAETLVYR
jgi:rubredoxin